MLDLKKLLTKILNALTPTSGTYITNIGNIPYSKAGGTVTLHFQGIGNGLSTTSVTGLPTPKGGGYCLVLLYYGSTYVANLEFYRGVWTFNRVTGTTPAYGSITYVAA